MLRNAVTSYLLVVLAAALAAPAQAPAQAAPGLHAIVDRMQQAAQQNRERYRAYNLTRHYTIFGEHDQSPSSDVVAEIRFIPPRSKEFTITSASGSSRGESTVRKILEHDAQVTASGESPGSIDRDNYDFTYLGEQALDGAPCFVLGLQPKRNEKSLVSGKAWVDQKTFLVRRVQGRLAKSPSWWLKSVEVTLDFGDAAGMWLPTASRAVADVRIFGPHTLTERALSIRAGATSAQLVPPDRFLRATALPRPAARRRPHPDAIIGTVEH